MTIDLTKAFAIRTIQDVWDRCEFANLNGFCAESKPDGSAVTEIDNRVEEIVLEHLAATSIKEQFDCVREEDSNGHKRIMDIKQSNYLVTIDGIDGTGDFIRHYKCDERNPKWLVALTAVYKRDANGEYEPVFAFGLQPGENRMFVMCQESCEDKAILIKDPLGTAQSFELDAKRVANIQDRGSLDVFLDKPDCRWQLSDQSLMHQSGPSGFNTASLAAAAAPVEASAGTKDITFTTFHYKLWDFGLWPVLHAAGFKTCVKDNTLRLVSKLNLNWFGKDEDVPDKCDKTPIILSTKGVDFDPLKSKLATR